MIDAVALWLIADLSEMDIFAPDDASKVLQAIEGLQELEERGWQFIPPVRPNVYARAIRRTTE